MDRIGEIYTDNSEYGYRYIYKSLLLCLQIYLFAQILIFYNNNY